MPLLFGAYAHLAGDAFEVFDGFAEVDAPHALEHNAQFLPLGGGRQCELRLFSAAVDGAHKLVIHIHHGKVVRLFYAEHCPPVQCG